MVEVPDHLAPRDGLCNHSIRLASMIPDNHGGATFNFEIVENNNRVAVIPIYEGSESDGLDGMFARAHRDITNIFRQLVHIGGIITEHYKAEAEKRTGVDK